MSRSADASVVTEAGTITYVGPRDGCTFDVCSACSGRHAGTLGVPRSLLRYGHPRHARGDAPPGTGRGREGGEERRGGASAPVSRASARPVASGSTWRGSSTRVFCQGPSIYAPGAILSQTGGHGDIHSFPVALGHRHVRTRRVQLVVRRRPRVPEGRPHRSSGSAPRSSRSARRVE